MSGNLFNSQDERRVHITGNLIVPIIFNKVKFQIEFYMTGCVITVHQ